MSGGVRERDMKVSIANPQMFLPVAAAFGGLSDAAAFGILPAAAVFGVLSAAAAFGVLSATAAFGILPDAGFRQNRGAHGRMAGCRFQIEK